MALAICAVLLSTTRLLAQSGGNASAAGIVSEKKSGELITGATITLLKDTTDNQQVTADKIRGAISNKYGFFSIPGITPGRYILSVRSIGHQTQRIPITIADGKPVRVDVQLEMQDLQQNGIVVEGTKEHSSTASISRVEIRPEFIQQLPAIGGETDIFRALQLLPGVKSVSEISSGLYVRGGSPDQNLTLLDGVIVYNPTHLGGFLSTFNSDAVRDIKLIKGGMPAEYGGRLSSVLDLTMREGTKEKISGTA
ncbi:MAG: carboxypeptidase regulatory-like domain-containing protein, partial [Candidatus Kapaibacterium sp.]